MKKIAIMTWYHYDNYGTVLQCTALQNMVRRMGYEADVIDYLPREKRKAEHLLYLLRDRHMMFQSIKRVLKNRLFNKSSMALLDPDRQLSFERFMRMNYHMTKECVFSSDLFHLNDDYDGFICGSDQIWCPALYDPNYYLDFVADPRRKIAYAPSIGVTRVKDEALLAEMGTHWREISSISVRETSGLEIIEKATGIRAEVVLDPTLLYDWDEWKEILDIKLTTATSSPYVLCYFLGDNSIHWRHARRVAKHLNIPIRVIPNKNSDYAVIGAEIVKGCGPTEFLEQIAGASVVCTDSFHGVAFSILQHKEFIAYKRFKDTQMNSQNSRIYDIMNKTGTECRLYNGEIPKVTINYKAVDSVLSTLRIKSKLFLKNALDCLPDVKPVMHEISNLCSGCGVCTLACTHSAIKLELNRDGFMYARIQLERCTSCMKCRKVCPFQQHENSVSIYNQPLYAYKSNDATVLNISSSGGFSHELSQTVLAQGHVVCGCEYDYNINCAQHIIIKDGDSLKKIQGSKYLQSRTLDAFTKIVQEEKALVFGTPCQIAGLHNQLISQCKRENFLLVDLICHGIPTNLLFERELSELRTNEQPIQMIKFRDKRKGWHVLALSVHTKKQEYYLPQNRDPFLRFFTSGNCYCSACYECPYRTKSKADIRIGDFWGRKYAKDNSGVSMVIALSGQGQQAISKTIIDKSAICTQESISDYLLYQQTQNYSRPLFYPRLLQDLREVSGSLSTLADQYCRPYERMRNANQFIRRVNMII